MFKKGMRNVFYELIFRYYVAFSVLVKIISYKDVAAMQLF